MPRLIFLRIQLHFCFLFLLPFLFFTKALFWLSPYVSFLQLKGSIPSFFAFFFFSRKSYLYFLCCFFILNACYYSAPFLLSAFLSFSFLLKSSFLAFSSFFIYSFSSLSYFSQARCSHFFWPRDGQNYSSGEGCGSAGDSHFNFVSSAQSYMHVFWAI